MTSSNFAKLEEGEILIFTMSSLDSLVYFLRFGLCLSLEIRIKYSPENQLQHSESLA